MHSRNNHGRVRFKIRTVQMLKITRMLRKKNTYLKISFIFNNSVKSYQIGISWMNFVVDFCDLWSEVELKFQFGPFFKASFWFGQQLTIEYSPTYSLK